MTNPRNATTTSKGRSYRWADETFTSVTTIISKGVPKPALQGWGQKMVATTAVDKLSLWEHMDRDEAIDFLKRAPDRDTEKAAAQGSDIHAWAEKYVLGQPVRVDKAPEAQRGYLKAFLSFLAEHHVRVGQFGSGVTSEATVYNREWGYAGTLDALLYCDGLDGLVLCDWKTGRSGIFPEVALQLSAYRFAEFIGLPDGSEVPMPEVSSCAALWLRPDGYELVPVDAGELAFSYFLAALQVADFTGTVGKQLLRPAVALPEPAPRPTTEPNISALTA